MENNKKYICPICGYPNLDEPPKGEDGEDSYEICPSCGVEFGCDDFEKTYKELRDEWLKNGAKWQSGVVEKPKDWNAIEQCREYLNVNISL